MRWPDVQKSLARKVEYPKFSGKPNTFSIWLQNLASDASIGGYVNTKVQILRMFNAVEGRPLEQLFSWVRNGSMFKLSVSEVLQKLKTAYPTSGLDRATAMRELQSIKRTADESVADLEVRFSRLVEMTQLKDDDLCNTMWTDALNSDWLRNAAQA